jgi:UDP:flavonoid glycosyltransferase YjiC (YdhE family)
MKFLFAARPAFGHVYPLMPLAIASREAGHDVCFATTGAFVDKLDALRFTTYDVGISIEQARDELLASLPGDRMPTSVDGRPDLGIGGQLFIDVLAKRTAADSAPLLDRLGPDVVVYEQFDLGAAVAAHAAGIPAVCHSISRRMPEDVLALIAGDRLARLWAEHGLSTPSLDVFTGDAFVDIFPTALQQPGFADHPARLPMRPIPFAEPGATVPAWVRPTTRRLVYLTLGTVVATDDVLRPAIDGLARLDADVLVALGSADGAELGSLPPNVHVEAFVDQAAVLRHADLAVHHGGSGTILAALGTNTPQLLLPKGADQFMNADAMVAAGMADVLEPEETTPSSVAAAAAEAIGNPRPAAVEASRELAAMPDPRDVLGELVGRFGRPRRRAA